MQYYPNIAWRDIADKHFTMETTLIIIKTQLKKKPVLKGI